VFHQQGCNRLNLHSINLSSLADLRKCVLWLGVTLSAAREHIFPVHTIFLETQNLAQGVHIVAQVFVRRTAFAPCLLLVL
jgi:hypothetical protein